MISNIYHNVFNVWNKPLSFNAAVIRDLYELERDRQIVCGEYKSNIKGSLYGYAVICGKYYEFGGYDDSIKCIQA